MMRATTLAFVPAMALPSQADCEGFRKGYLAACHAIGSRCIDQCDWNDLCEEKCLASFDHCKNAATPEERKEARPGIERLPVASIKRQAVSDPLVGKWHGREFTLTITRDGDLYAVNIVGRDGTLYGTSTGAYRDGRIQIRSRLGEVVVTSATELSFAGETLAK
jgi:hypothetical protein